MAALGGLLLIAAVLGAVHHAEVVAHKVGEPFGTIILAICITVLEVGLIVSLMIAGGKETQHYQETRFCCDNANPEWDTWRLPAGWRCKIQRTVFCTEPPEIWL
jgi:hypothetical protein